ncbi:MAG TPA: penicillin acylase family protein [Polyangiaceae bacterium]|nr:penicillin acylase family protein [Polyangiaceae bacterium]
MSKLERLRLPRGAPAGLGITRDAHGVPHIDGPSLESVLWGLGYCHALDRGMQLLLTRILGQGRASECLSASDDALEIDRFFRRLNCSGHTSAEIEKLSPSSRARLTAYGDGVNARLRQSVPWELRLVGYTPEPWRLDDTLVLSRVIGYVGLAQTQGDIERAFLEMVQAGVDDARLRALFPNIPELAHLDGSDPRLPSRELIARLRLGQRLVPDGVRWLSAVPSLTASNNWAIAPSKSRSGHALLSNDPHLEINRLPNVWYEVAARIGSEPGHYAIAATMPGLPAPLLGRTRELAWGATYTFMDAIDSWIEQVQGGRYRRGNGYQPFRQRHEEIKRKGKPSVHETFFENEHGVLDGDASRDGYVLATRWAAAESGARSLDAAFAMWTARDVDEGMRQLGALETAWNWMLADRAGNIGYQMSGLAPRRREGVSGFVPLPGWLPENDWQGFLGIDELPRAMNPAEGFLVTANDDLSRYSSSQSQPCQNATMADYRAERIRALIAEQAALDTAACQRIQYDTFSLQAERFMLRLRPLLPDSEAGRLLASWDCRYDRASRGAALFERFYAELIQIVIGRCVLGPDVVAHLSQATALFTSYFKNIDPLLLDPPAAFCAGRSGDDLYREAFEQAAAGGAPAAWGEQASTVLRHLMFAGRLPRAFGFDHGPIALVGGRATACQTQFYTVGKRDGCLSASIRINADLGEDALHTNLIGGPSDRRFSRWYVSDVRGWLEGTFKRVTPEP